MTKSKKIAAAALALGALPLLVFAQADTSVIPTGLTSLSDFQAFITRVGNFLFTILLALAVILILWAAFKYLTSHGDPEKVKAASQTLIYALVAVVVAVLARGLVTLIRSITETTATGG